MDNVFIFWLSVIVISTIGTLAHFFYDWSHHNRIAGLFSAVNESTWEHIKIALTAAFAWGLVDGFIYGPEPNYFLAKLVSLLVISSTIPAIFYFYRLFAKKSILAIDISLFYIAILLGQLSFYGFLAAPALPHIVQYLSCLGLFIFFGCYMTLTLEPLKTFLFKDPLNGKYGFRAHQHLLKAIKKKRQSRKIKNKS
ncbi:hypothetical protein IKF89_00860 [Candidatus Saccharibacteria bacterium]|nr:hypothetical protein [Candidatus Saccharibacteria bacterium]